MNIHSLYGIVFRIWRQKRMMRFEKLIKPCPDDVLLDVGGFPATWTSRPQLVQRIDCVNIHVVDYDPEADPGHSITTGVDNGCALSSKDASYDILFSNSVIEHVGDWEQQQAFADETRRVGKMLWIQTPAYECPLEPHYMAPFVHWLPVALRRRLLRWFTPWGWLVKPSQERIDNTIAFTRLLSKKQFAELYPDCVIVTERLLGIFPKSYIAYRIGAEA